MSCRVNSTTHNTRAMRLVSLVNLLSVCLTMSKSATMMNKMNFQPPALITIIQHTITSFMLRIIHDQKIYQRIAWDQ